jgi:hypothetical protein
MNTVDEDLESLRRVAAADPSSPAGMLAGKVLSLWRRVEALEAQPHDEAEYDDEGSEPVAKPHPGGPNVVYVRTR